MGFLSSIFIEDHVCPHKRETEWCGGRGSLQGSADLGSGPSSVSQWLGSLKKSLSLFKPLSFSLKKRGGRGGSHEISPMSPFCFVLLCTIWMMNPITPKWQPRLVTSQTKTQLWWPKQRLKSKACQRDQMENPVLASQTFTKKACR